MRIGREALTSIVFATCVAACSGGSDGSGTGTLTLSLMDRPVDGVTEVNVTISEMWIKPKDGEAMQLDMMSSPLTVNLLALDDQNASVLVDNAVVPAGTYNWFEMQIEDADVSVSNAMTDTGEMKLVDVDVPSGKVRLVSGFEVGDNQAVRFIFDWDVRKGLTDPVGRDVYLLRPAFRVLDVDELGAISGIVALATVCPTPGPDDQPVVYIFSGNVTPDDIDNADAEPVTTADVALNENSDYAYRAVVMPGEYTVALVCNGVEDTDEASEDLAFLRPDVALPVMVAADAPASDVDFTGIDPF